MSLEQYAICFVYAFFGGACIELMKDAYKFKTNSFNSGHWKHCILFGVIGGVVAVTQVQMYGKELAWFLYVNLGVTAPTVIGSLSKQNADDVIS